MKRLALSMAVATSVAAGTTMVAHAASDTSNATANIIAAIAIANTQGLDFGSVVPAAGADTVVVDSAGARTCGGTLTCTGAVTASSFDITGGNNLTYAITLPVAAVTLTSGANNMTVGTFTDSLAGTGTLNGAGAQTFTVGATLNVGAAQVAGVYSGTFSVTVDYN